jgi:hypothetical protein
MVAVYYAIFILQVGGGRVGWRRRETKEREKGRRSVEMLFLLLPSSSFPRSLL